MTVYFDMRKGDLIATVKNPSSNVTEFDFAAWCPVSNYIGTAVPIDEVVFSDAAKCFMKENAKIGKKYTFVYHADIEELSFLGQSGSVKLTNDNGDFFVNDAETMMYIDSL